MTAKTEEVKEWLTKQEARALFLELGDSLSERSILAMCLKGKLVSEKRRNPNTGQVVCFVSRAAVERMAQARQIPTATRPNPTAINVGGGSTEVAPRKPVMKETRTLESGAILAILEMMQRAQPVPAKSPRPWLTIEEAAEYSGLPAHALTERIARGQLNALDVGRRRGGRWRVRRADLDAMEGLRQFAASV